MSDESEPPDLFKLPVSQKEAWHYAYRAAGIAAYCWLYGHFVSVEKYEKDNAKLDARQAMIEKTLSDIDRAVARVSQQMEDEQRHNNAHP